MTIHRNKNLLNLHYFSRLRLTYAAIVDSFNCHINKNMMSVNRLLLVYKDDGCDECFISNQDTGQRFVMKAGCLYFIPCNQEVDWKIIPCISFISLHFNLDLFFGFDVFRNYKRCEMIENPSLVDELKQMLCEKNELLAMCRINELVSHLCVKWLSGQEIDVPKKIAIGRKYEKILSFIQKHGDATTTVEMLADMNCMRKDVFSRTFTRDIGVTPKDFISNTVIRKASEMLWAPEITVYAVADELHFSSAYYFSRFFKKHTGMSPKSFQKLNCDK